MKARRVYLDHAATTPLRAEARAAMVAALGTWHNPGSPHAEGRDARRALEAARARVAAALDWSGEVIFTSGATEAIGLALRGRGSVALSAVEHEALHRAACEPVIIAVDAEGRLLAEHAVAAAMVCIQQVNNETGVIQQPSDYPKGRALLLADCAQSAGKIALPDADLIAVSAHKLGGPPGVGALLVRDLAALEAAGGQERGYRPGTENLPAILGMAAALEADRSWLETLAPLRRSLEEAIAAAGGTIVGAGASRLATIGAYSMPGVSARAQLVEFDSAGFAVSAGSACASGSLKPSRVLAAMGLDEVAAGEVIRVSMGWTTSPDEVARFADTWTALARRRRAA